MTYVAFAVGLLAGSVLFLAGLQKLIDPERAAARAWRPASVGDRTTIAAMLCVGIIETTVALMGFVPIAPRPLAITMTVLLALSVSAYGLLALRYLGTCGCGAAVPDVSTKRALFGRNAALFGALLVGTALGPSTGDLKANGAGYALAGITAFYIVAAGIITTRSRSPHVLPG